MQLFHLRKFLRGEVQITLHPKPSNVELLHLAQRKVAKLREITAHPTKEEKINFCLLGVVKPILIDWRAFDGVPRHGREGMKELTDHQRVWLVLLGVEGWKLLFQRLC